MATIKYVINKSRKYDNGKYPIFIQILHRRKRRLISISKSIESEYWNDKDGKIITKSKDPLHKKQLNVLAVHLESKMSNYRLNLERLEIDKPSYSIDDVVNAIDAPVKSGMVFGFFQSHIDKLRSENHEGNARVYESTFTILKKFLNDNDVTFNNVDVVFLEEFESYLQQIGNAVNTISFHMRTFRALYNKAIKAEVVRKSRYPFNDYKIKREKTAHRALKKSDVVAIKEYDLSEKPFHQKPRDYFLFSFYTRGMSFVDMSHLQVKNIIGDRINYARQKTKQKISIKLTEPILEIIKRYNDLSDPESYLFPIIKSLDKDPYPQHMTALKQTNQKLRDIGNWLKLPIPLTTYVARHSWATIAKHDGISTAIISEGLGHENETTTRIYLDSFENDLIDNANDLVTNI